MENNPRLVVLFFKISCFLNVPRTCCTVEIVVHQISGSQLKLVLVKSDSPIVLIPFFFYHVMYRNQFPLGEFVH